MLRILILLPLLTACTSVFYQPELEHYPHIKKFSFIFHDEFTQTKDNTRLNYWYFPAQKILRSKDKKEVKLQPPKALLVQFHGNAQNLSSHALNLVWTAEEQMDFLSFDYRGYGKSDNKKIHPDIILDVIHIMELAHQKIGVIRQKQKKAPLVFYGQSLGGSLLLKALQLRPDLAPDFVVVESSFYSYHRIAADKLSRFFLTWPFQWMAYLLVDDSLSPGTSDFNKIASNFLLIYSTNDPVIYYDHGVSLYEKLPQPKEFWTFQEPGHLHAMWIQNGVLRKKLLEHLFSSNNDDK